MSSAEQTQNITKVLPKPMTFLSLAPETSASYPLAQNIKPATTTRRSSSVSSAGSLRVLKLGPVHWGEHPDEHKEDFHEVAVENDKKHIASGKWNGRADISSATLVAFLMGWGLD
ncbi:hypothetical protein F5Y19DRAFT_475945 [Xylariaceae sp. FL1651]|nr:hypothetical protein F5Y19DRAFT_475945 [Xylariaceae sp. FL1651]